MIRLRAGVLTLLATCAVVLLGTSEAAAQTTNTAAPADIADPCGAVAPVSTAGGGAHNVVTLRNATGGDLRVSGSVQVNQLPGPSVSPVNCAAALGGASGFLLAPAPLVGCAGCQTLAVALQIDLISFSATRIVPRNVAVAENLNCLGCTSIAIAAQYVLQVDDATQVPPDADALGRAMNQQLRALQSDHALTPLQAAERVVSVIQQFNTLAAQLDLQRQNATN